MGPGRGEEIFVGYQQLRAGCRCRAEGVTAPRDLGTLILSDLGPQVAVHFHSNLPSSFDAFPSRLNTSWFVGNADGISNAEVVMMVGGYDGGFGARVGCTELAILTYCQPGLFGPWPVWALANVGRACSGRARLFSPLSRPI